MKAELFRDISARYASIVGRRDGVRVFFKPGTEAYTDGNVIVVPDIPYGTVLSEHQVKIYGGYLDHEAAHCRETQFTPLKGLTGEVKWLQNVLEDVRVENIQISRYPGMKQYLDALCEEVDSRTPRNPSRIMSALYKEIWKHRGVDVVQVTETLDDMGLGQTANLVAQVNEQTNTEGIVKLATRILEMLKHEVKQQEEERQNGQKIASVTGEGEGSQSEAEGESATAPQQGNQAGDADSGQDKEGDQEDKGSAGADSGEAENDSANNAQPSAGNAQSGDSGMAVGAMGSSEQGQPGGVTQAELDQAFNGMQGAKDDSRQQALKDALKGEMEPDLRPKRSGSRMAKGGMILPPVNKSKDEIMVRPDNCSENFEKTSCTRLATELMRTLQARDRRAWRRDQEEGDLDTDSLPSVATGSTRVYQTKRDRVAMSTAIEVDIDLSGSMKYDIVRQCAMLLSEALNAVPKVRFQICGFHASDEHVYAAGGREGLGRSSPMRFEVIKRFEESYASARKYIFGVRTHGFTPLGDAYAIGMENLIRRREHKRILLVVTDGCPEFHVADNRHNDFMLMSRINRTCKKFGILTAGLVVDDAAPVLKEYFQVEEQFTGGDLVDSLLKLVAKLV